MCLGREKYKEISPKGRFLGRTLFIFVFAHIFLAFVRVLSYSFFAAFLDFYMVTVGFFVLRKYWRHPNKAPSLEDCTSFLLQCESQQTLLNFLVVLSVNFGLTLTIFVEMIMSRPTVPPPVGINEYDYRNLAMWQWWSGIVLSVVLIIMFSIEIFLAWWLFKAEDKEIKTKKEEKAKKGWVVVVCVVF